VKISIAIEALTGRFDTDMQRTSRRTQREIKKMQRDFEQFGRRVGLAISAAATGFAYMVMRTTKAADEMVKLGHTMGLTAEETRRLQWLSDRTGVSVQNLATVMQRATREISKARDGTGAAADALKQLGLNAGDLMRMNQEQRFAALAKAIKGVADEGRQAEIAYALFGRQGQQMLGMINRQGDSLGELSAKFDQFNLALSNLQADNVESLADAFTDVSTVVDMARQRFVADLAPAIEIVVERLFLAEARAGEFGDTVADAAGKTVRAFAFVMDAVEGVRRVFQVWGRVLAVTFASMELGVWQFADSVVNGPGRAINWLLQQASRIPGINIEFQFNDPVPQVRHLMNRAAGIVREGVGDIQGILMAPLPGQTMLAEYAERMGRDVPESVRRAAAAMDELAKAGTVAESAVGRMISAIEDQFNTLGQTGSQVQLYRLQMEGATEAQLKYAAALLRIIDAHEEHDRLLREAERVMDDNKTTAERFAGEISKLNDLFDAGVLSVEEYNKAVARIQDSFFPVEETEKAVNQMDEFARQAARSMQQHFADFLFNPFENGLKGMLQGFVQTIHKMLAEIVAAQLLQQLFGGLSGSGNSFLAGIGAAFGGSRDNGGRGYPGQSYLIGTGAQPEMFIPDTAGTFVPASKQGGNSITYQTIVQAPEGRITRESEGRARAMAMSQATAYARRNT